MAQRVALRGGAAFQFAQHAVGNGGQLRRAERVEQNDFVQAAHQLGAEVIPRRLQGLAAAAVAVGPGRAETERGRLPGQAARAKVGGQQDDRVGKIRFAALGVGQAAVLQNL